MKRNGKRSPLVCGVPSRGRSPCGLLGWVWSALWVGLVPATATAQPIDAPPPASNRPAGLPLQSILWDAEQEEKAALANNVAVANVQASLKSRYLEMRADRKIHVEIVGPEGAGAVTLNDIKAFGGEIEPNGRAANRADCWVPAAQLSALAAALPAGHFIERADPLNYDAVGGQGATSINSDSYRDAGANGAGRIIAVIDGGYGNLTAARNNGDAPALGNTTFVNYAAAPFENINDGVHGTGCVEASFDHCPGAQYVLYKINSLADMTTAVNDAETRGVDVITHSLSRYNTGWADNTGTACAAALDAVNDNMLFFTSAGNRAQQHWQGNFSDGDGDGWHQYSGLDERNRLVINNGGGGNFYLAWNTATAGTNNLDLYLYNGGTVIASSTNGGETFESFGYTNNTGATVNADIAVFGVSGTAGLEFEVFFHSGGGAGNFEYQVAADSTTSPSNATADSRVISNAAVDWSVHGLGQAGTIQSYSSRGPTNSNNTVPQLAGPTNTTTTAYGGAFGGTSAATPNDAGAACAFWSAYPAFSASTIRWLMITHADVWKDWGSAGLDNTYGYGGAYFVDWAFRTTWLARGFCSDASSTSPYCTLEAAYNGALTGGRILVFPGGNYPEPANLLGTKSLAVETVGAIATFGN